MKDICINCAARHIVDGKHYCEFLNMFLEEEHVDNLEPVGCEIESIFN